MLDTMSPTQPWAPPPPNPALPPDADPCAAGEESTERAVEAHRIQMIEPFPPLHMQLAPHQMPQNPFEPAHHEPDHPPDYALQAMVLFTPKEIQDQQAAQQHHRMAAPLGFHPNPGANPMPHQLPHVHMSHGFAAPLHQPPGPMQQQPAGVGQYPPAQQPEPPRGGPAPYQPLQQQGGGAQQGPGHLHGAHGVGTAFRGPPPLRNPPAHPQQQGPSIMRPLQVLHNVSCLHIWSQFEVHVPAWH